MVHFIQYRQTLKFTLLALKPFQTCGDFWLLSGIVRPTILAQFVLLASCKQLGVRV